MDCSWLLKVRCGCLSTSKEHDAQLNELLLIISLEILLCVHCLQNVISPLVYQGLNLLTIVTDICLVQTILDLDA